MRHHVPGAPGAPDRVGSHIEIEKLACAWQGRQAPATRGRPVDPAAAPHSNLTHLRTEVRRPVARPVWHRRDEELLVLSADPAGTATAQPLTVGHGAPLRLRNEVELGVKWVNGIKFVADFADIGSGLGGYNQDHEFFGYRQPL